MAPGKSSTDEEEQGNAMPMELAEGSRSSSAATRRVTEEEQSSNQYEEEGRQLEPGDGAGEEEKFYLIKANEPSTARGKIVRHAAILSLLVYASIWGTLAREGLVALNTYSGMSIEPTVWAQSVGCLVMGWSVANRKAFERWYPPMYIALGTGFCGSVTTFSTWILHIFQAFGDQKHYNRHGLHNVMDALTQTGATLGMSLISVSAGMALADFLPVQPLLHQLEKNTTHKFWKRKTGKRPRVDDIVPYTLAPDLWSIFVGILFWAASAILCGTYAPFREVTFAIVLAPFGAILRWYLSRLNSAKRSKLFPYWPLGTLAANLLATLVIAGVFVAQNVGRVSGVGGGGAYSVNGCHALYGVQEGFCGCLSTISTFAVELQNIKPRRRAIGYAVGSWVVGVLICVLVIGAPWWSIGMDGSCVGVTL
jgi:CrcB protein